MRWELRMNKIFSMLVIGLACGHAHAQFARMNVFGDSLSDTGNVYALTFGFEPPSPYWQGRYSNGPVWIEHLSSSLAIGDVRPSLGGGRNFAFGGAETGGGFSYDVMPNISTQRETYQATNTPWPDELFVIWGGGNDIIRGRDPQTSVNSLGADITALAGAGAKHFLVPNLIHIGYAPAYYGTGQQEVMNARSAEFNNLLAAKLQELQGTLGVTIYSLDLESLYFQIRANPSAFGFTNIYEPAFDGTNVVGNPDEYLWWDTVHPTRAAHELIGASAFQAVPEPGTFAVLTLGFAVLMKRRKGGGRLQE
jgi:thermolabile hemolysin